MSIPEISAGTGNIYLGEKIVAVGGCGHWDISNPSLFKSFSTGYGFQGLYINPNENVALTCQFNTANSTLRKYNYTDKDISTCQIEDTIFSYGRGHCIFANRTGTHIYIGTHENKYIYEYSTTNRDLDSQHMSLYRSKNMGHIVQSIWISDDERYLIVCNPGSSSGTTAPSDFWLYEMSTPGDISTATLIRSGTNVLGYNVHGIYFNKDLTKCLTCEYSASAGTLHEHNCDLFNSNTFTEVQTFTPNPGFTIGYPNITDDGLRLYVVRENGYIYQYKLY